MTPPTSDVWAQVWRRYQVARSVRTAVSRVLPRCRADSQHRRV